MKSAVPHVVALVEDHRLFADTLQMALEMDGYDAYQVDMVPELQSTSRFVTEILRGRPRTAVVDLDLGPQGNGLRLVQPLTLAGVSVVVVTGSADRVRWGECLRHGACKVVGKAAPLREIRQLMHRLDAGLPVMSRAEHDELLGLWRRHQSESRDLQDRFAQLTAREAEVLGMLMVGYQVSDIARTRYVSESTVRTQVKSVLAKLQVSSQLAAVGLAHRAHWHPPAGARTLPMHRTSTPGSHAG